jgi:hypothetical protein
MEPSYYMAAMYFKLYEQVLLAILLHCLVIHRAVFTHGPKGPGPRAANFQGRHIKKIEIELWYAEKKGCPRGRNLREIYTENTIMFCLLSVFVLFLLTHN